jgi:hypothetical protein
MHSRRWAAQAGKVAQMVFIGLLVTGLSAQVSETRQGPGFPEDWTHHRIKFSSAALRQHPEIAIREPRAAIQLYREAQSALVPRLATSSFAPDFSGSPHHDWSVNLGTGRIQADQYPAKWNSNPTVAPSCTADYVIYALNVAGATGGQAGMVAFNNLYAGNGTALCAGLQPKFLFAYNTTTVTGGKIVTSPVLNTTGTKVAFLETTTTNPKTTIFHVLNVPASNPGNVNGNSATAAVAVPAGAMSSLTIVASSDTRSSPWVDYPSDTAYVAADNGRLYKITGVFNGTPTLAGAPWPLLINLNSVLTSPVLDVTGNVFMGAGNGNLYSVNVNSPGAVSVLHVGTTGSLNPGIYDSPLLDSSGGSVFAISSNDSTTNHTAVVVQATTSGLTQLARVSVGQGSTGGTSVTLYDGDFDNNFTTPSSGHMLVCGTGSADTTPYRYLLPFDASGHLTPDPSPVNLSVNAAARCGPVTEFFNRNIGSAGTDFFFWSVTRNCVGNNGCVLSLVNNGATTGPAPAQENGGASGIIVDNNSTMGQASSIYFSTEAAPLNSVKLTQQGLN